MSSINSLLNHEPAQAQADTADHPPPIASTTYEAAGALTALASLGSNQQYVPSRELPSPTAFAHPPRRSSSFSSTHAAPVEPEPPIEQPQAHSPTLEQYHHGSKSPEEQRRRSLLMNTSPVPVLAPLHNLSTSLPSPRADEPTPSQMNAPESPMASNQSPPPRSAELAEPAAADEASVSPRDPTPSSTIQVPAERQPSVATENVDADTLKAIEIAKQSDLGLRVKRNASVAESVTSPTEPKPAPSKKRPAPSSAAPIKKKGTATAKKPASKKRKLNPDRDVSARATTPSSRTSKTNPAKNGKRGSQAGTPAAESSPAPDHSSQIHPTDDEGESSEDDALYCICRRPDNHRWMIGCDGGCDDWFHGTCVNMVQADEDLVDRFICPGCEEKGRGQTTWKPMCRREGCRNPARLTKGKESKYCSDECGTLFMSEQVQRTAGARGHKKKAKKKSGKNGEEATSDDDEEPTPLGGVLRAKDLKALVDQSKDIQAFKNLGSGVLSPPRTASPTKASFDGTLSSTGQRTTDYLALTAGETERLNALRNEISQLKDRLEVLKDRERFVSMVKDQATHIADQEKIKAKDMCGYDSRLSWSDPEFLRWRNSKSGRAAFRFGTLTPSTEQLRSLAAVNGNVDGDVEILDVVEEKDLVCLKKRCPKHPQWQKLNSQDARFEEVEIAESIRECEKEERSVRERALRRGKKEEMARELIGGDVGTIGGGGSERNREGWAEVMRE